MASKPTTTNIYGDESHSHVLWDVRHDDEIWADELCIGSCNSALDAAYIVALHNAYVKNKRKAVTKQLRRLTPAQFPPHPNPRSESITLDFDNVLPNDTILLYTSTFSCEATVLSLSNDRTHPQQINTISGIFDLSHPNIFKQFGYFGWTVIKRPRVIKVWIRNIKEPEARIYQAWKYVKDYHPTACMEGSTGYGRTYWLPNRELVGELTAAGDLVIYLIPLLDSSDMPAARSYDILNRYHPTETDPEAEHPSLSINPNALKL